MRHVVDIEQVAKGPAIPRIAADSDAIKDDDMIIHQTAKGAVATNGIAVVSVAQSDLESSIDGFRAGICEEHVAEISRRHAAASIGVSDLLRMRDLKARRVTQLVQHL